MKQFECRTRDQLNPKGSLCARLVLIFATLACLTAAVTASLARARETPDGDPSEPAVLTRRLIEEADESPSVQMAAPRVDSHAAAELPHAELGRPEALKLLTSVFGPAVEEPGGILEELEVDKFISDTVAVIPAGEMTGSATATGEERMSGQNEETFLLESPIPLRTEDPEGRIAPVELGLERAAGELRPANPLVETGIPLELGEGVSLGAKQIRLEFPGLAEDRGPSQVQGDAAFYPNVRPDTDLLVAPTSAGVETMTQLRTPEAPRTQTVHLDLPQAAELVQTVGGGAEATVGGRTLLVVPPPTAIDAAGNPVPMSLSVIGDDIKLEVQPVLSSAYPILADPAFTYEEWNWTWQNSGLAAWTSHASAPSYQALPYTYWDSTHFRGLDLTSGFPGSAASQQGAEWNYHVPRWESDMIRYGKRPTSYIGNVWLEGVNFLLEGNSAVYPEMIAGIIDESKGWVSVGTHSGYDGEISGWSGNFAFPNENPTTHEPDSHAQLFDVALATLETESQAKYRNAFVAKAEVALGDHDAPEFAVNPPSEWMNQTEPAPISYVAQDPGLGIYALHESRVSAEHKAILSEYKIGCLTVANTENPCPRKVASSESGRPTLPIEPASLPQGVDKIELSAEDPLAWVTGYLNGQKAGSEPYPHITYASAEVRIDHTAPTLALSGSLTEQAGQGTARPQYTLGYRTTDGSVSVPTLLSTLGTEGSGNGQFKHPADIAIDPENDLWVADDNNNRIEKLNSRGEYLASYGTAGAGNGQLSHPTALASDSGGDLYVADAGNNRVEEFNKKGEYLTNFGVGGSGNGQLSAPGGIAIDSKDNVWVADTGNNRVDEFNSTGVFLRSVGAHGPGNGLLSEPGALAVAPEGDVYVADSGNNRVAEFNERGEFVREFGTAGSGNGQFEHPDAIEVDNRNDVWVADQNDGRVEQFTERGEYLGQFGSKGTGSGQFAFMSPSGIGVTPAGALWVADSGNNRLEKWAAPQGNQSGVRSVAIKLDGNLLEQEAQHCVVGGCPMSGEWILRSGEFTSGSHVLEVIASDGVGLTTIQKRSIELSQPVPTLSLSGTLTEQSKLGDSRPRYVLKASAAAQEGMGGVPTKPAYGSSFGTGGTGNGQFSHPADIGINGMGDLWVVDDVNDRIEEFTSHGEYLGKFGSKGSGNGQFNRPTGIAIGPNHDIYIVDSGNNRVEQFNENGEYLGKFGIAGSGAGQVATPEGIAVDSKGDVWVADTYNSRLEEFNERGEYLRAAGTRGTSVGQMLEPDSVDVGPGGNVWVTDWSGNKVVEFNERGEYLRQFGSTGSGVGQFNHPAAVAVESTGNVWVADQNDNRVEEFNEKGEYLGQFGSSGSAVGEFSLGFPIGIAVNSNGGIWVTDTGDNRVEQWTLASRSQVETEVTVDGNQVAANEVRCETETCPLATEWVLSSSAYTPGSHTVIVKSTDGFGFSTTRTLAIGIERDAAAPTVHTSGKLADAPGGWVQQESYELSASATDVGSGTASLSFKLDGATLASSSQACTEGGCGAELSRRIDMAAYSGGAHQAEVVAVDGAGNAATKRWTINVDPEGRIAVDEATATMEAVDMTSPVNVVGEAAEEEAVEGTAADLGVEAVEGQLVATNTDAPLIISPEVGEGFAIELPPEVELPCDDHEENETGSRELCAPEGEWEHAEAESIQITPIPAKEAASAAELVEGQSVVASNIAREADSAIRPLTDGGMTFEAIRGVEAPEEYSWRVELGPEQELEQVDSKHVEVEYGDGRPAFAINAMSASDANGTEVPTSLSVRGSVVTLTVAYKAGHGGEAFVYPIVAGTGWQGGFQTVTVDMDNRPPEEDAGEPEEGEVNLDGSGIDIMTFSPPVGDPERKFKFTHCDPHYIPHSLGVTEAAPINVGGEEDKRYNIVPKIVSDCSNPEFHGIYWAVSIHGHYHYQPEHWVWAEHFSEEWCTAWGEEAQYFTKVHCKMNLGEVGHGSNNEVHGPIEFDAEFRFPPGRGANGVADRVECYLLEGFLFPRPGPLNQTYERPMRSPLPQQYVIPQQQTCNWK